MRTTITIDEGLLAEAKQRAARAGKTLSALIQDALRADLRRPRLRTVRPFRLVTFGGSGAQPGVNLERLGDLLEEEDNVRFIPHGRQQPRRQRDSPRRKRPRVRASS